MTNTSPNPTGKNRCLRVGLMLIIAMSLAGKALPLAAVQPTSSNSATEHCAALDAGDGQSPAPDHNCCEGPAHACAVHCAPALNNVVPVALTATPAPAFVRAPVDEPRHHISQPLLRPPRA